MKRAIYIFLAAILFLGCAKQKPLYQGLPLKSWMERLDSDDPAIRADALDVIYEIGPLAWPSEDKVRRIAREDPYPDIRLLAVEALDAMDANTVEFQEFIAALDESIIPVEGELEDSLDPEAELEKHFSGADDLAFLKAIAMGLPDTGRSDTTMVPADSAELVRWIEEHRSDAISGLLRQLENPVVLAYILEVGNLIERQFAARMLAEMEGEDAGIVGALKKAAEDPDSLISNTAAEALKRWIEP